MPKTFYTEYDMDDLKARGVTSIDVTDKVVMTDLAVERAFKHGIKLIRAGQASPNATYSPSVNTYAAYPRESPSDSELKQKIRAAVLVRLHGQVDDAVLDATIMRVMQTMKSTF